MKFSSTVLLILCGLMLLSGCGDELSGLPDPEAKAPSVEPDSFSFETATVLNLSSSSYGSSVTSSVPSGQTRYYQFTLDYFDVGTTSGSLAGVTLTSADDSVELAWYSPSKLVQEVDDTELDFSSMKVDFYGVCCDGSYTFYMTVKNATELDINYSLAIEYVRN